eukprot:3992269-Prymnesium_polylepis.2
MPHTTCSVPERNVFKHCVERSSVRSVISWVEDIKDVHTLLAYCLCVGCMQAVGSDEWRTAASGVAVDSDGRRRACKSPASVLRESFPPSSFGGRARCSHDIHSNASGEHSAGQSTRKTCSQPHARLRLNKRWGQRPAKQAGGYVLNACCPGNEYCANSSCGQRMSAFSKSAGERDMPSQSCFRSGSAQMAHVHGPWMLS